MDLNHVVGRDMTGVCTSNEISHNSSCQHCHLHHLLLQQNLGSFDILALAFPRLSSKLTVKTSVGYLY